MAMIEISIEERIEEARARLKTAYDQYQTAPAGAREITREKWEERKRELNVLLNNQKHRV